MSQDYKFALQCWQRASGSEDAKINVYLNDKLQIENQIISANSIESAKIFTFDWMNGPDIDRTGRTTVNIRLELTNPLEENVRAVFCNYVAYLNRYPWEKTWKYKVENPTVPGPARAHSPDVTSDLETDFNTYLHALMHYPVSVLSQGVLDGDWKNDSEHKLKGDFWGSYPEPAWYTIPVDAKGTVIKLSLSLDRAGR